MRGWLREIIKTTVDEINQMMKQITPFDLEVIKDGLFMH